MNDNLEDYEFGKELKYLRNEREKSQEQVANDFGIGESYLSQMENGRRHVNEKYLKLFAKEYGISFEKLKALQISIQIKVLQEQYDELLKIDKFGRI